MTSTVQSVARSVLHVKTQSQVALQYVVVLDDDLNLTQQEKLDIAAICAQATRSPAMGDHPALLFSKCMHQATEYGIDEDYVRRAECEAKARTYLVMWRQIRAMMAAEAAGQCRTFWGTKEA